MGHLLSRFGVLLLKDGLEPRLLLLVGMSGQAQVFVDVLVTCRLLIANQFSRLVDFDLQNERKKNQEMNEIQRSQGGQTCMNLFHGQSNFVIFGCSRWYGYASSRMRSIRIVN